MQLGSLADVHIYGTSSSKKQSTISNLGGIPIDYTSEDFVERIKSLTDDGVDVVFDPIGGKHLNRSYQTLRKGGRLIAYGERSIVGDGTYNSSEAKAQEKLMDQFSNTSNNKSIQWYEVYDQVVENPNWFQEDMEILLDLLAHVKIQPLIANKLPLDQCAYAHRLLETSAVVGKNVLICNE